MESPNVSKLSKEELQVIADEEEAERVYQAELAAEAAAKAAGRHDHPVPRRKSKSAPEAEHTSTSTPAPDPTPEPLGKPEPVAPEGTQILREVLVQDADNRPITHYYVLGIAPPYAGIALWLDIVTSLSSQEKRAEISRRLRGLAPDPAPQPQAAATY